MTWDIAMGLCTLAATLVPVFGVVLRVNRSLVSLEEAVKQLRAYMEKQSARNREVFDRLGELEQRVTRLEAHEDTDNT